MTTATINSEIDAGWQFDVKMDKNGDPLVGIRQRNGELLPFEVEMLEKANFRTAGLKLFVGVGALAAVLERREDLHDLLSSDPDTVAAIRLVAEAMAEARGESLVLSDTARG